MKKYLLFLLVIATHLNSEIRAQEFQVFLYNIEENRSIALSDQIQKESLKNQIKLSASLNGILLDKNHMVKVSHIEAVDDKGKKIRVIEDAESEKYSASKLIEIKLEALERQTKSITINGELLYFTPTTTNKGRIVIQNFKDSREDLIVNATSDINFKPIPDTEFFDLETSIQNTLNEKLTQEVELSEEAYRDVKVKQRLLQLMALNTRDHPKKVLNFKINLGPQEFYSIKVYNHEGSEIKTDYKFVEGIHQLVFAEKIIKGSYIEILVENENSVKTIDFRLENILLP